MKQCTRCKKFKTEDNYGANKKSADGLHYYCHRCCAELEFEKRHDGPDCPCRPCLQRRCAAEGKKSCLECNKIKPFEEYWLSQASKDGRSPRCIPCHTEYNEVRYQANRERIHDEECDCGPCVAGGKKCRTCKEFKSREEFSISRVTSDGMVASCKECSAHHYRWLKYRMDRDTYLAKLEAQDGKCAICTKEFDSTPHTDHDHACCAKLPTCGNCNRDLVCGNCNKALGLIKDDPDTAMALACYLLRFQNVLTLD